MHYGVSPKMKSFPPVKLPPERFVLLHYKKGGEAFFNRSGKLYIGYMIEVMLASVSRPKFVVSQCDLHWEPIERDYYNDLDDAIIRAHLSGLVSLMDWTVTQPDRDEKLYNRPLLPYEKRHKQIKKRMLRRLAWLRDSMDLANNSCHTTSYKAL